MHTYATNCPHHPRLIMWLTFVAIAVSTIIGWLAARFEGLLGIPIGGVSAVVIFGGLYLLFDKHLWTYPWARSVLLVPDLNGDWDCEGVTTSKNGADTSTKWSATVCIAQSWSNIVIVLTTGQSKSRSIAASLYQTPGEGYRLIYHYDNSPQVDQPADLKRHTGLCDLVFDETVTRAEGRYFTDRDRLTVGTMKLTRKERTP